MTRNRYEKISVKVNSLQHPRSSDAATNIPIYILRTHTPLANLTRLGRVGYGSSGAAMMNEGGGGVYDYDEIWPGFHANSTSYSPRGSDPMLTDQRSNRRKRRGEEDELCAKGGASTSSSNGGGSYNNNTNNNALDGKRLKAVESNSNKLEKTDEPSKQDYIHVRARRGQATDSHSLAERARREKIGERMKTLQDIVPGCNKVIGKALVLDEIINYVQSLQRQVEFLSMKLEAVNAGDGYSSKVNFAQQTFEAPGIAFGSSQNTRDGYSRGSSPKWLHMQIGGEF